MKKLLAACVCAGLSFSIAGCSPGTVLEQFTSTGDTSVRELTSSSDTTTTTEAKDRVYMDELSGTLQDFSGSQLILNTDSASYVFNVSNATLECKGGMITGDEISIIYEGQLSGTDTSSVHVLKVVDEYHKKNKLKKRTAHGQVISLTSNTITIKSKKGKTATYPITGTEQYYQNGIKVGNWVYLTFKGKFPDTSDDASASLNASHLKVLSISDLENLQIPDPTPTPAPNVTLTPEQIANTEKQFLATIQGVNANILQILPAGSDTTFNLDMSAIPAYFKGGIAPGSHVNVTYIGDLQTDPFEAVRIIAVTGEDPDTIDNKHISFTASGTIIGSTANTITLQTDDGAVDTFRIENAENLTEGGMEYGDYVLITFHPSRSKSSNIYTAVKVQDS
ncbi:hypothetical protein DWX80_09120 [Ruminococcus sp. AF21-3]|jgi:hypothetical protein|nr:hypothetical protein DWX80_09120 [Ruminococcus sp. AF21-3]